MLVCSKRKQGHYAERITDIPCPDSGFLRFDWSPLPLIMLYTSVYVSFFFFKLYFIDYAITVFPNFPPLSQIPEWFFFLGPLRPSLVTWLDIM